VNRQILVPLRGSDHIEEILPYVRDIAQPGMTVVFLVNFCSNRFNKLAAQLLMINSGSPVNFDDRAGEHRLSAVERKIQQVGEQLRQRGVATRTKFYTGSLRRLVRQCAENEPVKWVIIRPARSLMLRWWHAAAAALRVTGPPTPAPVLLFDPNSVARR